MPSQKCLICPTSTAPPSSAEDSFLDLLIETLDNLDKPARSQFLQKFLKSMAQVELSETVSLECWDKILARRQELSESLSKPISLKTVMVDVLASTNYLRMPILMEYEELKKLQTIANLLDNALKHTGAGMGVEFESLDSDAMQRLTSLLATVLLGNAAPGPDAKAEDEAAKGRRFKRVELPRGLIVAWQSSTQKEMSIAPTVGRGGMFIATLDPAPNGTPLRLLFEIPGGEILATGLVRDSRPGRGMGIEFTQMGAQEIARLETLLHKLLA